MYLKLEILCDKSLPSVILNEKTNELEINGCLYHFKSELLFEMILNWLHFYFEKKGKEVTIRFDLELISARSMKIIYIFLKNINQVYINNEIVKVIWLMNIDDEHDRIGVELIKELVPLDFKIQQKLN
ncbi:MAG: SiaC family regulatory phosphoprotein [Bacteroidota bacterium]